MVRVLAGGVAAFALAYAGFAATDASIPVLAVAFALAGVGIGCVETAEHAAVATLAPDDVRGSACGVLAAVQSFGNVVASAVAGLLYTVASPEAAFAYAAALMLGALLALVLGEVRRGRARLDRRIAVRVGCTRIEIFPPLRVGGPPVARRYSGAWPRRATRATI